MTLLRLLEKVASMKKINGAIFAAVMMLILAISFTSFSLQNYFTDNLYAIESSKSLFTQNEHKSINFLNDQINNENSSCHEIWLSWVRLKQISENNINPNLTIKVIECSIENTSLVRMYFPQDVDLAKAAINYYPDHTLPLLWLYNGLPSSSTLELKVVLEKIIAVDPKDGFAWSRLAYIYQEQDKIELALSAFINACNYGDIGVHGCYGAGKLYEQQGEYSKAIEFYRKSRWKNSQEQADRLEAELSSQNP